MSRIGIKPVPKLNEITATLDGRVLNIKGPLGELSLKLPVTVSVNVLENEIVVERKGNTKQARSDHGTTRAHIANMIEGVTHGYKKELEIVGMGYRAVLEGRAVVLSLGWSHTVKFEPPEGITFKVNDGVFVEISGIDKQQVGLWAAKIRGIRKPEPYRGKGIRYKDEAVRRKVGKSVEKTAAK
jgi:large subunit ribosomal protein L6